MVWPSQTGQLTHELLFGLSLQLIWEAFGLLVKKTNP